MPLLLALTSACTGERPTFVEGPDATLAPSSSVPDRRPGTVTVEDWADSFCGTFHAWQEDAIAAGDALVEELADTADPATVRDSLVGLLDGTSTRTDAFAAEIREGPVPDVDGGATLVEALAQRFDAFAETFRGYRDQAVAIDIDDPDRFTADVAEVFAAMAEGQERVAKSFEEIDEDFPDAVLQGALRRSCGAG